MKLRKKHINAAYYVMVLPIAVLFFIFHTVPFLEGVFYSFTNWKGYGDWDFAGLSNYYKLFKDTQMVQVYRFTFFLAFSATVLVNIVSLLIACGLNSNIKFKNGLKAVYFLPYVLGVLIIGFVFNYIFANILPLMGKALGIAALSNNILGTNRAWIGVLFVTVWQASAFNTMIYVTGFQTVDKELYDAAAIDGAGKMKRFLKITFPLIAPFFTVNMVLSGKNFLMSFDQIMAMTNGGPGISTTTISVMIYKYGFSGRQFAYQSANSVVLFIIIASISLLQKMVFEKREEKLG